MLFKTSNTEAMRIDSSGDVYLDGSIGQNDIRYTATGRRNGNTTWQTVFTSGNTNAQAMGVIRVCSIYGTPSGTCGQDTIIVRGNKTYSLEETLGSHGSTLSYQWSGNDFQVKAGNSSLYYSVTAELHSIGSGYEWNHTWSSWMV